MAEQTDEEGSTAGWSTRDREGSAGESGSGDQAALMEDMQSLMDAAESGFRSLRRRQTTKGVVVSVGDDAVLVDVGAKSEGIIPREELAEMGEEIPHLVYGQEILVQVLEPDSRDGPVLSLRRARREQAWVDLETLAREGALITAVVVDHNRGGAILDVRGLRGFIPLSQLSSLPPASSASEGDDTQDRLGQMHGRRLTVKVLEADQGQNRLILSERAASDELRAQRRGELLAELEPGQIRRGTVRSVTNFGAFVDLGGADGLVHVSEMSYDRFQDPRSLLKPGQEVEVYVLEVRPEDSRISLSIKRATLDPWSMLEHRYQAGQIVSVTVTRLMNFGAFAQIEPGIEGLIHISELADAGPKDPGQIVQTGQTVQAKIIHIDMRERKLGLSLRQVNPVPIESQMTADQWHAEQDRQGDRGPSAFDALSHLREAASEEVQVPDEGSETEVPSQGASASAEESEARSDSQDAESAAAGADTDATSLDASAGAEEPEAESELEETRADADESDDTESAEVNDPAEKAADAEAPAKKPRKTKAKKADDETNTDAEQEVPDAVTPSI